ncbi:type IV pilus biogenesis protein PilM [Neisseriaceae bacterium B1]
MRFKKTEKNTSNKSTSATSGKSVIGLDIGQSAIKMVQISGKQANQVQLEKYAIEYLPQHVISGNEIIDYDQLVSHLQQCYSKLKTNCKQVNLALPFGSVTIEEDLYFDPKTSDMSLQEFVESQVSTIGSLDEMNYDWAVLGENPKTGEQSVLMVAAKTESVEKCSDLADDIGVTAINVDVDLFAIANAFAYADSAENSEFSHARIALFDIGDSSMKSLVMEGGRILYKQESSLGLEQLIQLIQRTYQVLDTEAVAMINGSNPRPTDYNDLVSSSFNMQIAQEVQRAIQFFLATQNSDDIDIKHVFISGSGCIAGTGVAEMIYAQTGIPTRQIAPISLTNNKTKVDNSIFEKDANALTIAFGLALRGLV